MLRPLTLDKKKPRPGNPVRTDRAERNYALSLSRVAQQVGEIINGFPAGDMSHVPKLFDILRRYAEALIPWAEATARRMLEDVNARDLDAWRKQTKEMGAALREELANAPTGDLMRALMDEQVTLIKSIPLDAAQRVHDLTMQGMEDSSRFPSIVAEIQRSGQVAESRARLIARTETARAASTLTQARAMHIGSPGYVWVSSHDGDVRADHKKLDNNIYAWDAPPVADSRTGARAHPGQIYNCRCWARVIVPEE